MTQRHQFTLRLDDDVYSALCGLCERMGVSRAAFVQAVVTRVALGIWDIEDDDVQRERALGEIQELAKVIDNARRSRSRA